MLTHLACGLANLLQAWNGDTTDAARSRIISDLGSDEPSIKLLYTTPESLKHPKLREALTVSLMTSLLTFAVMTSTVLHARWSELT